MKVISTLVKKNITLKILLFPYWATLIKKGIFYDKRFIRKITKNNKRDNRCNIGIFFVWIRGIF